MKNKIFQVVWQIKKVFIKIDSTDDKIENNKERIQAQLELALKFDKNFEYIGLDSNGAVFSPFRTMCRFKKVTVNIAVGGTTPEDWLWFFSSVDGKAVYKIIEHKKGFVSIGGNCVLQRRMKNAEKNIRLLRSALIKSIVINVPPVRYDMLDKIDDGWPDDMTADEYQKGFTLINKYLSNAWSPFVIDIYTFIMHMNITADEKILIFKDAVHYGKYAVNGLSYLIDRL